VWNNLPALRNHGDADDGSIGLRALGCADILKVCSIPTSESFQPMSHFGLLQANRTIRQICVILNLFFFLHQISNALHGIFAAAKSTNGSDMKLPELPQIVVVGGQSSGKSSLLNGIMSADILPLGETLRHLLLKLTHSHV